MQSTADLLSIYQGQKEATIGSSMSDAEKNRVEFYRSRFVAMDAAKQSQMNKFRMIDILCDAFDEKIIKGHKFGERVRFPKAWAAVQRKEAEVVDYVPAVTFNSTFEDKKDNALSANSALKHFDNTSNERREDCRVRHDMIKYGTGIKFIGYARKTKMVVPVEDDIDDNDLLLGDAERVEEVVYDGQMVERVNPKDFWIDENAYVMHDVTGTNGARDCFWLRVYSYSQFLKDHAGPKFKNIDLVIPAGQGASFFGATDDETKHESEDEKGTLKVVNVFLYQNTETDMWSVIANGIEIYYGANPYRHKKLTYSVYYNYRRDDSFWGLSELEIQATFIYVMETFMNLGIEDAQFALQPSVAVDGDLQTPKNGLRPGGVLKWKGLAGGKLKDSIMPLRFGGLDQSLTVIRGLIEDEQIATTGDDIRALYINPDQLATNTLTKRESRQKRIRQNVYENTVDAKKDEAMMKLSNIIQFGVKPVKGIDGRVHYRRVKIEGYDVRQESEDTEPKFEQKYGAQGYFYLNSNTISPDSIEIEAIPTTEDEMMRKDEMESMMRFLQAFGNILSVAQANPVQAQRLAVEVDLIGMLKQVTKRFSEFDQESVFPTKSNLEDGKDMIDLEHEAISFGHNPTIKPDEDSKYHLERHMNFLANLKEALAKPGLTADTKKNIAQTIKTLTLHINDTTLSIRDQAIRKVEPERPVSPNQPDGQAAPTDVAANGANADPNGVPGVEKLSPELVQQGVGGSAAQAREQLLPQRAALRTSVNAGKVA